MIARPFPLPLLGFPILCTRWNSLPFASSIPRASSIKLTRTFLVSSAGALCWAEVFKRFRYFFKLQVFQATVGFQIKDLLTAFIDICFSRVSTFLKLSDFSFKKICVFFHIGKIFFKRLLFFFNGHDVSLYTEYLSLKTLHCQVKLVPFFCPSSLVFR